MKVLVAAASRHGATHEIAEAIGRALTAGGVQATVATIGQVDDIDRFDAFVFGSAVYMGRWMETAREFVDVRAPEFRDRPVWLFSSGPIGNPPKPGPEHAVDVADIVEATGAREHRLFSGRVDRALLNFGERAVMLAVHGTEGDFRDWTAIAAWGTAIANALTNR